MKKTTIILLLCLCFLPGCSENRQLGGKITFSDGQPVKHGTVLFNAPNMVARGEIIDGYYTMGTLKARDGLPPGDYQVSVTGVTRADSNNPMLYLNLCDDKYTNAQQSGLTCKVPAPGNKFDIVLEPHPKNYP